LELEHNNLPGAVFELLPGCREGLQPYGLLALSADPTVVFFPERA